MDEKRSIYDLDLNEIKEMIGTWGIPGYRAGQIWQGLYVNLWKQPEEFSNLPASLRDKLAENFGFSGLTPATVQESSDGETVKTLFKLRDGKSIETVLMKYDERRTLCISSQSGCAMGCVFCATGQMGFQRHLTSGEIVEQVLHYSRQLHAEHDQVTNIVIMGMGEPFHNYDSVLGAIDRLNDPKGANIGARRFTISTVGLVPGIRRFAAEKRQVNLAISLHSANNELRSSLLPINKKYPLEELIKACREYLEATNRRITFEWALIQNVNDNLSQAAELADLVKGMLCHVNIIPLNPTVKYAGTATTLDRARAFRDYLESRGVPCTIRIRRGIDIQAGCGQLASQQQSTQA